jgi:hypothetical protein
MKEEKFTLAELEEQLKVKQIDRDARIQKFYELIGEAEKTTDCILQIDLNSKLNDLRIIVVSKI